MKKISILFLLFVPIILQAQDDIDSLKNDLIQVSDDEILEKVVTAPTKIAEKINEASASVNVYTDKDIRQLGYYTLNDLASITSGYGTTLQYAEKGLETRGFAADAYNNNKHLMLVDGISINLGRSNKVFTQEELPLFFAKRVELMKGPASALYGTGAYYGVINVHRKNLKKFGSELNGYTTYSPQLHQKKVMFNAIKRNKYGEFWFSGAYFSKEPSLFYLGGEQTDRFRYWDGNKSYFTYIGFAPEYKWLDGFTLGLISISREGQLGEMWLGNETSALNKVNWEALNPFLKFEKNLNDKQKFATYIKYNVSSEQAYHNTDKTLANNNIRAFNAYKSVVRDVEWLGEWHYTPNINRHIIVGANFDARFEVGNPESWNYYVSVPVQGQAIAKSQVTYPLDSLNFYKSSEWFRTISIYAQLQQNINFLKGTTVTAGLRSDNVFTGYYSFNRISPRIVAMQRITKHWNLKAMYGRALRAPTLKEVGLNNQFSDELNSKQIPSTSLNSLSAEWIESLEIASNITVSNLLLSLSIFKNNNSNTITNSDKPYNDSIVGNWFYNQHNVVKSIGFELELKYKITENYNLFINSTYIDNSNLPKNVTIANTKINAGLVWFPQKLQGSSIMLVGKYLDNFTSKVDMSPNILYFDANIRVPLLEMLTIECQMKNIFNQKYNYAVQNTVVPTDNRFIYFGISLNM